MTTKNIFKFFKTSPEITRPAVRYYVRYTDASAYWAWLAEYAEKADLASKALLP